MPDRYLVFCPYLRMNQRVAFADWELGPLESFEDRWADDQFKDQTTRFLRHFVGIGNKPINSLALLCRNGKQLDGQKPKPNEVRALELSLAFAVIDQNPRSLPENHHKGSWMVTADNAELFVWPIDLASGRVITSGGYLIRSHTFGYEFGDHDLVFSPPVDLHVPLSDPSLTLWY